MSAAATCREHAERHWKHEGWGEPANDEQTRLWTLFFTNLEPDTPFRPGNWTRPPLWVEHLIRYGLDVLP